jgi:hypothetical protein
MDKPLLPSGQIVKERVHVQLPLINEQFPRVRLQSTVTLNEEEKLMASPHQFRLSPSPGISTAAPLTLTQELAAALQGGQAIYDFFSGDGQALQTLYETIATSDDTAWLDGTDQNGNPMKYVAIGNNYLSVYTQITDPTPLQNGTGDPTTYKAVGSTVVVMTTDFGSQQLMVHTIEYAGEGFGGLLAAPLIGKILMYGLRTAKNYVVNLVKSAFKAPADQSAGEADEDTDEINSDAAEGAGEEGAEIAEGVAADFTISAGSVVAAGVGAAIVLFFVFLQLIGRQINNYVRFYNVTAEDIQFGICMVPDGESSKGPAAVGQTASITKVSPAKAPPGVMPKDTAIYYSQLAFNNSNPLTSIGYILEASPNSTTGFPGFRIAISINGGNQLYIAFVDDDCNDFWENFNETNQQTVLTMKATSGKYILQIATNQEQGQSPSPLDATEGYNFEHLLVLTDGSIPLS